MASRKIEVEIIGDASSLNRTLGAATKTSSKFGTAMKAALIGGAAAGFYALGKAAKIGWDEFNQGQQVVAQTNAAIKSTGGVAGVTARHVSDLASAMLKKTGIDDEATATAENMLLTFTRIGAGGGIFDQTTKAVADMATRMNGGAIPSLEQMNSTSITVGKALNNPITGLGRLTRVGVEFSDKQKELITRLEETGKHEEAQKLILRELQKEFGGSAEAAGKTLGGQLTILKENFANTAGEILGKFMPLLIRLANVLLPLIAKGLAFVADWIGKFADAATQKGGQVHGVFEKIWSFVKAHIIPIIMELKDIAVGTFDRLKKVIENNRPALERIGQRIGALAKFLISILLPVIKFVFQEVLPRAVSIAIKIIDKVSAAIEKVVGWFKTAKDIAKTVFGAIKGYINDVRDAFGFVVDKIQTVIDWVKTLLGWIAKIHIPGLGGGSPTPGPGSSGGRFGPTGIAPRAGLGTLHVHMHVGERELASVLVDLDKTYRRANGGRPLFA